MKLCIFSDIHGNGPAFEEALPRILSESADLYLFLGDLCGYYYDQIHIFSFLKEIPNLIAIKGNHDRIFLDIMDGNENLLETYRTDYGKSMDLLLSECSQDFVDWMSSLPNYYVDEYNRFCCFHGSPDGNANGYIYPDTFIDIPRNNFPEFCFLGHTHYKMNRHIRHTHFINPGSLGQPRDGSFPTYVVVDTNLYYVIFKYVKYNKDILKRSIDSMNESNQYLKTILDRKANDV